jgi:hypothetical protein
VVLQGGKQQRYAEQAEQHQGGKPAVVVGFDSPSAADRGQGRHRGESCRHPGQQRQATADERPVRSGENEGQDRKNARTDDRQSTP